LEPTENNIAGVGPALKNLADDLDLLTNRLKAQLLQRFEALQRREQSLTETKKRLEVLVREELATENEMILYLATAHDLHRVGLDLEDTREAIGTVSIDNAMIPDMKYNNGDMVVTLDSRKQN